MAAAGLRPAFREKTMNCNDETIKEQLPAYVEGKLAKPEQGLVEAHLATCADCRKELSLLKMMSEEAVPDPGEAFWSEMPDVIYREVRRSREKKHISFADILNALLIPRWAWATAGVIVIAIAASFFVRTGPVNLAGIQGNGTNQLEMAPDENIDIALLSPAEIEAAAQWARNEFGPIREQVVEESTGNTERDPSDDLNELNTRELDRVYEMLKKKEQDMRNRMNKTTNEKGLV